MDDFICNIVTGVIIACRDNTVSWEENAAKYQPQLKTRGLSAWQLRCLIVYATLTMSNCLW